MLADAGVRRRADARAPGARAARNRRPRSSCDSTRTGRVVARAPGTRPAVAAGGDRLAYVIYTSGSTGAAQGRDGAPRRDPQPPALDAGGASRCPPDDRVLQKTTLSFDASVWECFAPLMAGARLVLARPEGQQDTGVPRRTPFGGTGSPSSSSCHRCSRRWLEEPGALPCGSLRLRALRRRGAAAELAVRRSRPSCPGAELHNLYGPTEAAVDVTSGARPRRAAGGGAVPIGPPDRATPGRYVLDARLAPAAGGRARRALHRAGAAWRAGYLGRAGPDGGAVRAGPVSGGGRGSGSTAPATASATGADGTDRVPRPHRPPGEAAGLPHRAGEIEAVLLGARGVKDAVVVVREDEPGDRASRGVRDAGAWPRVPGVGAARARERAAAGVHGPLGVRRPGVAAAEPERQGGPARAAGAGAGSVGERAGSRPRTPVEEGLAAIWGRVLGVRGGRGGGATSSRWAVTRCWRRG